MTIKTLSKTSSFLSTLKNILTNRAVSLLLAVMLSLTFTSVIVLFMKASPWEVFGIIIKGAFGSWGSITQVLQAWVPLVLVCSGLMFTFTAGLWNIGMEGQITMGAIFAYGVVRSLSGTPVSGGMVIVLATLAGAFGGAFWAVCVGALKIFGGVSEIFGGLGLNFISEAVLLYLVFSPWKPEATASGSTDTLNAAYWLPQVKGTYLSLWSLALAILGVIVVFILLKGTYFGLRIKAVGKNNRSSMLMGIPTSRYMIIAFLFCGVFAGLTGATQVMGFHHVLRNNIASGYGYLGLMVGMISNYQPLIAAPIAFLFMALKKGGNGLNIDLKLDSNLSGVIQATLVLFVIMMEGVRRLLSKKSKGA